MPNLDNDLIIAGKRFHSRLLLGTGKFSSNEMLKECLIASESEIVTVAIRRVDFKNQIPTVLSAIPLDKYQLLPNTSGARNAEEAIHIARLAKSSGLSNWIKLEVIPDLNYLMPDPVETFSAAKTLIKEGFVVLPYIQADPVLARQLEDLGCATVMPLASPIGSNKGLRTKDFISMILERATIPVIVDAGLGAPSHISEVMEMGVDGVLVNTLIATSTSQKAMAKACKMCTKAGRLAYLAGLPESQQVAQPSSPLLDFLP